MRMFEDHSSEAKENNKVNTSYTPSPSESWRQDIIFCLSMSSILCTTCPSFFDCPSYEMVPNLILFKLCFISWECVLKCDAQNWISELNIKLRLCWRKVGQNGRTNSLTRILYSLWETIKEIHPFHSRTSVSHWKFGPERNSLNITARFQREEYSGVSLKVW